MPIDLESLREVARVAGEASGARRVVLFGSVARGEARHGSDLDLLLVMDDDFYGPRPTLFEMVSPAAEAEQALGRPPYPLDLVPMRASHLECGASALALEVLREGVVLYERPASAPRPVPPEGGVLAGWLETLGVSRA